MTSAALATLDHSPSTHSLPSICRGLFAVFVAALAEALAPRVVALMADHWEDMVAAKARADDQPLSLTDAAKAIKIRPETLQKALREPEDSPWHLRHLRGAKRGGASEATYLIRWADLEDWNRERRKGFEGRLKRQPVSDDRA